MRRHPPQCERPYSVVEECRKWANFSLNQAAECESTDGRAEWIGLAEAWIDLESSPEWAEEILHTGRGRADCTTRSPARTLRILATGAETLWRAVTAAADFRKVSTHHRPHGGH